MDKRKELILNTIIKEHIKSGAPVGSSILVEKYKLDISPATVRNEMMALEDDGYIMQPHTSAGRIPTEKAYSMFLENLKIKKLAAQESEDISNILKSRDESDLKDAAKAVANISGTAVFWAFHRHNLFYTGISNLLKQPEFREFNLIYDISAIIDHIDEVVDKLFDQCEFGRHVLVGSVNPFGNFCSTVLVKYKLGDNIGLVGILGPIRMDYEKNIAIADFIKEKLG